MSGSSNLNSFRDRGQVAVQLVSCGVLLLGLTVIKISIYLVFKFDCSNKYKFLKKDISCGNF